MPETVEVLFTDIKIQEVLRNDGFNKTPAIQITGYDACGRIHVMTMSIEEYASLKRQITEEMKSYPYYL